MTVQWPMTIRWWSLLRYAVCALGVAVVGGCASAEHAAPSQRLAIDFPDASAIPRVTVLGPLTSYLPTYDETPTLDRFLYGPNDRGKTILRNPQGMVAVGHRLLICDQGHADVISVNLADGRCDSWCPQDYRPRCPIDIAADGRGKVFVADSTGGRILVYDVEGNFLERLRPEPPESRPCAVEVRQGIIYVANMTARRIERYDTDTTQWLSPLIPPADREPLIAPAGLAMTSDGTLLIADAVGGRLQRVTTDGRWLDPIGEPGRLPGQFVRPKGVCVTSGGLILTADAGRQSVLVFQQDGTLLTEIQAVADQWQGWTLPCGVTLLPEVPAAVGEAVGESGEYAVVSDSLGGESLTLLRITVHKEAD